MLKSIDHNANPQKEKLNQENENMNSINSVSNAGSNLTNKNKFKKSLAKNQVNF